MDKINEGKTDEVTIAENEQAWNDLAYEAWCAKYGEPTKAAERIVLNAEKTVGVIMDEFGDVKGKKVANLMGSHGMKALALAQLGADAVVFDFSEGNRRYALEMAKKTERRVKYVLADVTSVPEDELTGDYDLVFAEMGILHYFSDLSPLLTTAVKLLKKGGLFVVRDFHPISTKLISSRGTTAKIRKHKVDGDYFDDGLVESEISYGKYLPGTPTQKVFLRKWTLGEIVTAVAGSGLMIVKLKEEPNLSGEAFDKGIPKTFTLTARKI